MKFSKRIRIGKRFISDSDPVFIIAEAGVNHNGKISLAKRLIDMAANAGADAVKFQAFRTEELILNKVKKAPYQEKTTSSAQTQFEMLKKLEISRENNKELAAYCRKKKILFLTTPFDDISLKELDGLGLSAYKISSTDLTNLPFLRKVASKMKPVILSTGMSYMSEVESALREIGSVNKDVILMQCTSDYPVGDGEVNLSVLNKFRERFDVMTGFSDHTSGIGAAPFSVPMGARVIEKHFTLDKNMKGPDHKASLSPKELKELISMIRKAELFMGSSLKEPTRSEKKTRASLQKNLVAARAIKKGRKLSAEDIGAKRTGGRGISPIEYHRVMGTQAKKDYAKDDIL
jgi:N,N'-diacetyllegionaminate synthase